MNGRYLRHHLRHRHSSRDLLTSPEAESITSSAPFPNSASVSVNHPSHHGRQQHLQHHQHQLLQQPLQRMAVGKRSSWPRALHPPSSADLCSSGDVIESPIELQLPPFQTATSALGIRRLSRPRQPSLSLDQTSALMTAPTISDRRPLPDDNSQRAAIEEVLISPEGTNWRRSTYKGRRTSTAIAFSYGRATETASMCSIDAITYVSGLDGQASSANVCLSGGGDGSGGLMPTSRSSHDIETPLSAETTIGGTSGTDRPQTSGVDCETVIRCLDSCDKILLRHSTTITWFVINKYRVWKTPLRQRCEMRDLDCAVIKTSIDIILYLQILYLYSSNELSFN